MRRTYHWIKLLTRARSGNWEMRAIWLSVLDKKRIYKVKSECIELDWNVLILRTTDPQEDSDLEKRDSNFLKPWELVFTWPFSTVIKSRSCGSSVPGFRSGGRSLYTTFFQLWPKTMIEDTEVLSLTYPPVPARDYSAVAKDYSESWKWNSKGYSIFNFFSFVNLPVTLKSRQIFKNPVIRQRDTVHMYLLYIKSFQTWVYTFSCIKSEMLKTIQNRIGFN